MRSAILGGTSVFSSMLAPLSSAVPASQAVKVEDKGNIDIAPSGQVHRDQCYKNVRNQVQRLKDLMKSQRATGRAQPAPPPPVQHPPPPPPPPPANRTWTKRPATGPPPALAGFRQPPQKQHHLQPAPNAHCTPPPPGMPPVNTSKPPLHPRYSAEPFAVRRAAAAAKKSSVVCGVCNVWCMSVFHLKQHERGRKHRDKVASIAGEKNVQCQVCNVQLASELNVVQHYAGKQHRQRLQRRGANGTTGNQATWHDDGTYQ